MKKEDAAIIIDSMIQALKTDPGQFDIIVNITGQSFSASGGGIGAQITAIGGEAGSTTIGNQASINRGQIEITQRRVDAAMNEKMDALIQSLTSISDELKSSKTDYTRIESILSSIKGTWVPSIISSIIGSLLSQTMGIPSM